MIISTTVIDQVDMIGSMRESNPLDRIRRCPSYSFSICVSILVYGILIINSPYMQKEPWNTIPRLSCDRPAVIH